MKEYISLSHGSGGALTRKLVHEIFAAAFDNAYLRKLDDASVVTLAGGRYAMTTDSFVVDPIVFPGGDIGKLAVCGTVNDLASCGAEPKYLSASFVIEEGFALGSLRTIVSSMAREAREQKTAIVTGDTKVVPRGKADKLFINTTGIGFVHKLLDTKKIRPGDKILINGPVAQHGLSILASRQGFEGRTSIKSDCKSLWGIVKLLLQEHVDVHFMRDPTRGGVSAAANEIAQSCGFSLALLEKRIPATASCRSLCEILGLEPLDIANEGKMLFFVGESDAPKALRLLRSVPSCRQAALIGEVLSEKKSKVYLETSAGGSRVLGMPVTDAIPRIC
ncbi:MAG: hydrogenase expression/formation protein HypE [Candidatus Omnitrophica bacterium]|nr:hydrogenase expression/formation protein HypE [Candidatus Omnitrophota bacterium]MDD5574510.1 hydrogenase expression/formation protein HypE [Candidatus Omnitrophota bacterium]